MTEKRTPKESPLGESLLPNVPKTLVALEALDARLPASVNKAIEMYLGGAKSTNPHVEEIYVSRSEGGAQFFTVVSERGALKQIYEVERCVRFQYPALNWTFREVSSDELTPEQREDLRRSWIPSGDLAYKRNR